jgi:hypothetical protein
MYFNIKNNLKSNRNHTAKQAKIYLMKKPTSLLTIYITSLFNKNNHFIILLQSTMANDKR